MGKRAAQKMDSQDSKAHLIKKVRLPYQSTKEEDGVYTHQIPGTTNKSMGLSDVLTIEHAVNNLQMALKVILEKSLSLENLEIFKTTAESDPKANPEVLMGLLRSKLTLAARLRSLYDADKMPIFDQIINFEDLAGSSISGSDSVELGIGKELVSGTSGESKVELRDDGYPVLPEIKNRGIRARVFTHKSLVKDKPFISDSEIIHAHNERFEFIGDSVLNNIISIIIYNALPNSTEGEMSQIRSRLISNVNLQKWAAIYGFEKELRMNTDDSIFKGKLKIYADVFEAYVGGLITEDPNNYSKIYKWLEVLAKPVIMKAAAEGNLASCSKEAQDFGDKELNTRAKVELYSLIGYAGLGLHYDTVRRLVDKGVTEFTVQVKTRDGDVLGTGTAKNTKEAGYRAAMNALDNKPMIEKYIQLRASIPRDESVLGVKRERKDLSSLETSKKEGTWQRDNDGKWMRKGSTSSASATPAAVDHSTSDFTPTSAAAQFATPPPPSTLSKPYTAPSASTRDSKVFLSSETFASSSESRSNNRSWDRHGRDHGDSRSGRGGRG